MSKTLVVGEEMIGEAIRAIKYLLEQGYFEEKIKGESIGFVVDSRGRFAAEFAIDFLVKVGHAEWIKKPRRAKIFWG